MVSVLLEQSSLKKKQLVTLSVVTMLTLVSFGCASEAPSIAHVHIGHAITGHGGTPNNVGYFQLAEQQAQAAAQLAGRLNTEAASAAATNRQLNAISDALALNQKDAFNASLQEAANHIVYAANSDDASMNVRRGAGAFESSIEGVLVRTDLMKLYLNEAGNSDSAEEVNQYAMEIQKLIQTNLNGEDLDGNGFIGDSPDEYGIRQLRRDLDTMIAAENPPYRTVDRWYLFNLIRLPSGDWIFRRNKSGASAGYQ